MKKKFDENSSVNHLKKFINGISVKCVGESKTLRIPMSAQIGIHLHSHVDFLKNHCNYFVEYYDEKEKKAAPEQPKKKVRENNSERKHKKDFAKKNS